MFVLFFATVALVLERVWKMSYAELFALSIPGAVMYGLAALPAGWLADRWSSAGMIAICWQPRRQPRVALLVFPALAQELWHLMLVV